MSRITSSQLNQVKNIIQNHMDVIGHITVGGGTPPPELLRKLNLPKNITDLITTAYSYGKLSMLQGKDLSNMNPKDVEILIRKMKLTPSQQYSVEQSKIKAQSNLDSLTQKLTSMVTNTAIQSDLQMYSVIGEVLPAAMEFNTPRYKVIQMLRDKTGDFNRDWHRVAQTEMWDAKLQGEAEAILSNEHPMTSKGAETLVYKKPAWNCCNKCRQLYLESDGVTPKVFKLSELMANGSNYGKKQADWKPTLGVLHPNCQCVLNVKPDDTEFDASGNLVYKNK